MADDLPEEWLSDAAMAPLYKLRATEVRGLINALQVQRDRTCGNGPGSRGVRDGIRDAIGILCSRALELDELARMARPSPSDPRDYPEGLTQ